MRYSTATKKMLFQEGHYGGLIVSGAVVIPGDVTHHSRPITQYKHYYTNSYLTCN